MLSTRARFQTHSKTCSSCKVPSTKTFLSSSSSANPSIWTASRQLVPTLLISSKKSTSNDLREGKDNAVKLMESKSSYQCQRKTRQMKLLSLNIKNCWHFPIPLTQRKRNMIWRSTCSRNRKSWFHQRILQRKQLIMLQPLRNKNDSEWPLLGMTV